MKLLLTSTGLYNDTIKKSLLRLIGKRPDEIKVSFVPTAGTFMNENKTWLIDQLTDLQKLGFPHIDIVDISALSKEEWEQRLEKSELLVFGGGNPFDLMKWLKKTGLDKILPELLKTRVYVGNSSGAIVVGKKISSRCEELYELKREGNSTMDGLGFVDFSLLSHYKQDGFEIPFTKEIAKELSKEIGTLYAIDDDTAIMINGDEIEVVSEGEWEKFE